MATARRQEKAKAGGTAAAERKLLRGLRDRLAHSLLPGEPPLTGERLDEAADFLLEAAATRAEGEAALLVRSAIGERRVTRIAIVNRDMPFLVDSIAATIAAQNLAIDLLLHPILPVERDPEGRFLDLADETDADAIPESMIYLETGRVDAKERRVLERELALTLADVRVAVSDWHKMRALMAADAERLSDPEGAELLRWFEGGMLTLLGHLTHARNGKQTQRLGICRKSARELAAAETYERAFAWFKENGTDAPLMVKANRLSRVHRRVPLDLIIVPVVEDGRVAALSIHTGIWTSAALAAPPQDVPVLRRHLDRIARDLRFQRGGHDAKALIHALTVLPHDLVIGFTDEDLAQVATATMALADRPRPRLALVMAPLRRHLFGFVWLPRDMMSTRVRLRIQDLLERSSGADTIDWSLQVEGGNLAVLRYVLDFRGEAQQPNAAEVEGELADMLRGWADAVEAALAQSEEPSRAAALATRYAEGFPEGYRIAYGPAATPPKPPATLNACAV